MKEGSAIAVQEQLYRKVMKGKRTTYEPYTPPSCRRHSMTICQQGKLSRR